MSAILIANPSPVRTDYRHISKLIRPAPAITLDDAVLKWYDIAPADEPVPLRRSGAGARESARSRQSRDRSVSRTTSAS